MRRPIVSKSERSGTGVDMANLSKAVCHGESDKCRFGNPPQESNFQRLGIICQCSLRRSHLTSTQRSGTLLRQFPPSRIVCLTEETVETLYLLGEQRRIVGVSGYAVRPPQVRKEKPRVSAFISADFEKIIALKPDLVLTFSDLQADISAELVRRHIAVHAFNQRDIAGILDMIRTVGALVGVAERAEALAVALEDRPDGVRR